MTDSTGIRVEGGRELRASLKAAGRDLNDLKEAHKQAADLVTNASKPGTPRGKTGKLAGSLRGAGTATQAIIRAGGARVRYAGVQHFGWAARHISPRPWITETAQRTEPAWTHLYENAVEDVLATIRGV